jgi:alkylhydroperoxidase family enzyme
MGLNRAGIPSFVDVSVESGLASLASGQKALGFATADFDVDGNLDVFIASFDLSLSGDAGLAIGTSDPNLLLMNQGVTDQGIPTFTDATAAAGVAGVDVFGRTDDTADQSWKPHTWVTYASDVNADGLMDIFALNEAPGYLELYINQGDGSFAAQQEPHNLLAGGFMGISSADVNSDGHLDYFVTNLGAEYFVLGLPPEVNIGSVGTEEGTPFNLLLLNDGEGSLASVGSATDITPSSVLPPLAYDTQAGLDAYGFGWGPTFFDANNDGAKDLYWVGSHWPGMPLNGVGRYLEGDGTGAFTDLTAEANLFNIPAGQAIDFANAHNGYSALSGDIDGDGDSDLVVVNGSDSAAADSPAGVRVFRNVDGNNARQLTVNLRSRSANTFGIGARVELLSISTSSAQARNITAQNIESLGTSGFDQVQIAEIVTTTGAFSATQPMATFGLGSDTSLHLVKVTWPDGSVSRRLVKPTDTNITVRKR